MKIKFLLKHLSSWRRAFRQAGDSSQPVAYRAFSKVKQAVSFALFVLNKLCGLYFRKEI